MSEEIEKMYENAGVEKDRHCTKIGNCYYQECSKCDYYNYTYPPFTDDKQLKLIKWFIRNESDIEIIFNWNEKIYYFKTYESETIDCRSFKEALANLINIHFEDFTDEEKEEIRNILK